MRPRASFRVCPMKTTKGAGLLLTIVLSCLLNQKPGSYYREAYSASQRKLYRILFRADWHGWLTSTIPRFPSFFSPFILGCFQVLASDRTAEASKPKRLPVLREVKPILSFKMVGAAIQQLYLIKHSQVIPLYGIGRSLGSLKRSAFMSRCF